MKIEIKKGNLLNKTDLDISLIMEKAFLMKEVILVNI